MPGLNQDLARLSGDAIAAHCQLAFWDGVRLETGRIYVYWPFLVFRDVSYGGWNVSHAPTGCHLDHRRSLSSARELIASLHATGADWAFVSKTSRKARLAERLCAGILPWLARIE